MGVSASSSADTELPQKGGRSFELVLAPTRTSKTMAKRAKPEEIIAKLRDVEVRLHGPALAAASAASAASTGSGFRAC